MTPEKAEGPAADRTPKTATNATNQAVTSYPDHATHMRQLADRIGWLDRHEHWYRRCVRWHQAECRSESCRRCYWVAA